MTEFRRTSAGRVARWRLDPSFWDSDVRVRLPMLNPNGSMIYPPLAGELPAYELLLEDGSDKENFKEWVFTLSAEDQEKVRNATILERIK